MRSTPENKKVRRHSISLTLTALDSRERDTQVHGQQPGSVRFLVLLVSLFPCRLLPSLDLVWQYFGKFLIEAIKTTTNERLNRLIIHAKFFFR